VIVFLLIVNENGIMQITQTPKNKTGKKPAPVIPSGKPDNIFDLIFGMDDALLKIMIGGGTGK